MMSLAAGKLPFVHRFPFMLGVFVLTFLHGAACVLVTPELPAPGSGIDDEEQPAGKDPRPNPVVSLLQIDRHSCSA